MIFPLFFLILISFVFVVYNFIFYLNNNKVKTGGKLFKAIEIWTVVIVPALFTLMSDLSQNNDCCTDSAIFSPEHRIGIYILLITYTIAYIVSIFRKNLLPPLLEIFTNSFLILGLILNIVLCIHLNETEFGIFFWGFGNIPIILLLLLKLSENQKLLRERIDQSEITPNNLMAEFCLAILKLNPILKYPILTILLVPIIALLSLFLILFGQKPDSIIRAFTDTYKHGFSQLDYMCDNVECGGHFLCSVGANGHRSVVKPIRYGERNGKRIICNRQLLVSNAFEELIQEKLPKIHRVIRKNYNKVGNVIHKHYYIFNNKFVSDFVYIMMKPLELVFILTLYTFDNNPENRISIQYLNRNDSQKIYDKGLKG